MMGTEIYQRKYGKGFRVSERKATQGESGKGDMA